MHSFIYGRLKRISVICAITCLVCTSFIGCRKQVGDESDYVGVNETQEEGKYHSEYYTAKKVSKNSTDYASDSDVDAAVKEHVIGETVECKDKGVGVEGYTYQYVSKDRDLHFDVDSVLRGYGGMLYMIYILMISIY